MGGISDLGVLLPSFEMSPTEPQEDRKRTDRTRTHEATLEKLTGILILALTHREQLRAWHDKQQRKTSATSSMAGYRGLTLNQYRSEPVLAQRQEPTYGSRPCIAEARSGRAATMNLLVLCIRLVLPTIYTPTRMLDRPRYRAVDAWT